MEYRLQNDKTKFIPIEIQDKSCAFPLKFKTSLDSHWNKSCAFPLKEKFIPIEIQNKVLIPIETKLFPLEQRKNFPYS